MREPGAARAAAAEGGMITDAQLAEWERLAGAAGPFAIAEESVLRECPLCDGDGEVESVAFDAKNDASTVVAYGIGDGLGRAEAFVERAPGDVLRLVAALREARALLADASTHLRVVAHNIGVEIERGAHQWDGVDSLLSEKAARIDAALGGES